MKNKKLLFSIVIIIFILAIFGLQNQLRKPINNDNVIKIGAILALSGPGGTYGQEALDAIKTSILYNNRLCKDNNARVEIVVEDSKTTAKDGLLAYQKLRLSHPEIKVILSHASVVTNVLSEQTLKDNIMLVAESSVSKPVEYNKLFYVNQVEDQRTAQMLIERIDSFRNVLLFYLNDDLGCNIYNILKSKIDEKITGISFEHNSNLKDIVLKSKANDFPCAIIAGYGKSSINLIKELKNTDFRGVILGIPGMLTEESKAILRDYSEGLYFLTNEIPDVIAQELYEKEFNRQFVSSTGVDFFSASDIVIKSYINLLVKGKSCKDISAYDIKSIFDSSQVIYPDSCIKNIENQHLVYKIEFRPIGN